MNPILWETYIHQICQSIGYSPKYPIMPGLAGTYPTFIIDQKLVIKVFGQLFDGLESFRVEKTVNELISKNNIFPSPLLIHAGELSLEEVNPWRYLVFEYMPGIPIGTIMDQIPFQEKIKFAVWLGDRLRELHQLRIIDDHIFSLPNQQMNLDTDTERCVQRQLKWGKLPNYLIDQIGIFLDKTPIQINHPRKAHLIHADLTGDHFLGEYSNATWTTNGVIDFGDAMIGSLDYELIAIHLDLFRCNKTLLREFYKSYEIDFISTKEIPYTALRLMLLHRFSVFNFLEKIKINKNICASLDELADQIWNIDTPSITVC